MNIMLLGYTIIDPDMNAYMLSDIELNACAKYSNIYDLNIVNPNFKVPKRAKNISTTYEGYTIVSEKFKTFCEVEKYEGLEFVTLPSSPEYYWFKVHNILEYDTDARLTRFLNYNEECNGYEEIIGITPVCLKTKFLLEDKFYRTNICAGSFVNKSPMYMVGEKTKEKLKEAGFKEIFFEKILDKYKWQEDV